MGTSYYFAYGSNMHVGRIVQRLSHVRFAEPATLAGHTLRFHKRGRDGSGKCNVLPDPGSSVAGAVFTLDSSALSRLDRIEGSGYRRVPVIVTGIRSGRRYRANCYAAKTTAIDDARIAYEWYRDIVVAGAAALGLPAEYVEWLRSFPARPDPNRRRQQRNMAVMARGEGRVWRRHRIRW